MKIVLFGRNGQLGRELQHVLAPFGEVVAVDRQELDLQDLAALDAFVRLHKPQVIVNASAYTAVDRAEQEQDIAFQVNGRAPELMAELACAFNAAFIHVSTDYVFDGALGKPYVETDTPNPLNVYGKSKLAGEQAIQKAGGAYLILRTSWVYSMDGDNFVTKLLGWARKNPELRVVDDQVGSPTWSRSLAEAIALIIVQGRDSPVGYISEKAGLYHLAGNGFASRFEWANLILELDPDKHEQVAGKILPASTHEFPDGAQRPLFSALDCGKFSSTFGYQLLDWQESLQLVMTG